MDNENSTTDYKIPGMTSSTPVAADRSDWTLNYSSLDSSRADSLESVNRSLLITTNESLSVTESDSRSKEESLNSSKQNPELGNTSNEGYGMMLLKDDDSSKSLYDPKKHMAEIIDGESELSTSDQAKVIFETPRQPQRNLFESPDVLPQNWQSESSSSEINKSAEENKSEVSSDSLNMSDRDNIKSPDNLLYTWLQRGFNFESLKSRIKSTVGRNFQYNSITPDPALSSINCPKCSRIARGIYVEVMKMRENELESPNVLYNNFRNDIPPRNHENSSEFIPSEALASGDSTSSDSLEKSEADKVHTRKENRDLASGDACHTFDEKMDEQGYFRRGESEEISATMMPVGSTFMDAIPSRMCDLSSNQPFSKRGMGNNTELKDESGETLLSQPEKYSDILAQEITSESLPSFALEIGETHTNVSNEIDEKYRMEASSTIEDILSKTEMQQDTPTGLEIIENNARESNLEVKIEEDAYEMEVEHHMEVSSTMEDILSKAGMMQDTQTGHVITVNKTRESNLEVANEEDANEIEVEHLMEASSSTADISSEEEMEQDTPPELQIMDNKATASGLATGQGSSATNTVLERDMLLELFNIDNNVSKNILLALESKDFVHGGTTTDLLKHLKKELTYKKASELKQEIQSFLKHAVTANILEFRNKRYFLSGVSEQKNKKQSDNSIKSSNQKRGTKIESSKYLSKLRPRNIL